MNEFPVVLFASLMSIVAISIVSMVVNNNQEAIAPALVAIGTIAGYTVKAAETAIRESAKT